MPDALHYLSLSLCNIRAFSGRQVLDLSNGGKPSRWCVIIGENGVGKTTVMQALAAMRPVPAFDPDEPNEATGKEANPPLWAEPVLTDYENDRILSLVRRGEGVTATLEATLAGTDGKPFTIGYHVVTRGQEMESAAPIRCKRELAGKGPFVVGYSAFRLPGHGNLNDIGHLEPTESLFDDQIGLLDPDEVVGNVDYILLDAERAGDAQLVERWSAIQQRMTEAVAALIPDLTPAHVSLKGRDGIRIKTPSGDFPFAQLSFGAQTTIAWVLDLAWRLTDKFPESLTPLEESAIVLIDEVELHLHPKWQRALRQQLLRHFPNTQFIVTTHAPVTAQESIAAGDPISVIRWEGDHAAIVPDPFPQTAVRLDEVATELFELDTSLPKRLEELLRDRRELVRKSELSAQDKEKLIALNEIARAVRAGSVNSKADLEQWMAAVPELAPEQA